MCTYVRAGDDVCFERGLLLPPSLRSAASARLSLCILLVEKKNWFYMWFSSNATRTPFSRDRAATPRDISSRIERRLRRSHHYPLPPTPSSQLHHAVADRGLVPLLLCVRRANHLRVCLHFAPDSTTR